MPRPVSGSKSPADETWKRLRYKVQDRVSSAGTPWTSHERLIAILFCGYGPKIHPSQEPQLFVRRLCKKQTGKACPGYQYDYDRDAEAKAAALAGEAHPARNRVKLSPDLEPEKERLQELRKSASKRAARGTITDEEYRAELLLIKAESERLARRDQRMRAKPSGSATAA